MSPAAQKSLGLVAIAGLAVVFVVACVTSLRVKSVTIDEFGHLPAGINVLHSGDTAYCRLHPPLANVASALPLLGADLDRDFAATLPPELRHGFWENGGAFMARNPDRYHEWFVSARYVTVILGVLMGLIAAGWARAVASRHAPFAGVLAAALVWMSPNVIAHARLVTTDVMNSATMLAASAAFFGFLRRPNAWWAVGAAVLLGLAQATKISALFVYPAWVVVAFFASCGAGAAPRRRILFGTLGVFVLSLLVLNLAFGMQGTGRLLGDHAFVSETFQSLQGVLPGWLPIPLPDAYLGAVDLQAHDTATRGDPSFLFGESFHGGRWDYFFALLAIKVPIPTMLLAGWALVQAFRRRGASWLDQTQVLLPSVLLLLAFSFLSEKQIGLRLVLPLIVAAMVWIAVQLAPAIHSRRAAAVLIGLLAWLGVETGRVHPHYLTYFNQFVGGPSHGHHYALGSNLDWGQDLIGLREWMGENDVGKMRLLYYGRVDPALYGIDYEVPNRRMSRGLLAVSRTFHSRGYWVQDHGERVWRGAFTVADPSAIERIATIGNTIDVFRIGGR